MEVIAVCHVHSEWSYDGSWTLAALASKFRKQGCRVLMMTEHDRGFSEKRYWEFRDACARVSSDEILVVPGLEYSDAANRVHVLVWGDIGFLGESLPTSEMLKLAYRAGGLSVLAHPSRRDAWKCFEPSWADMLIGIEIWNRKYDGWAPGNTAPALIKSSRLLPFAGLDFHTARQSFPLTMALDVQTSVTEKSVLDCLRSRRCSARAFGVPLNQHVLSKAIPILGMAEKTRQAISSVAKRTRLLTH